MTLYDHSKSESNEREVQQYYQQQQQQVTKDYTLSDQLELQRLIKQEQEEKYAQNMKIGIGFRERLMMLRKSCIFSLYFLTIIPLCLFLLVYAVFKRGRIEEVWYVCLEGLTTTLLFLEFLFNLILYGIRKCLRSVFAWIHFISLIACVTMLIVLVIGLCMGPNAKLWVIWGDAAYVEDIIVAIQCLINLIRIIVYFYQYVSVVTCIPISILYIEIVTGR
jgi:hypothetical protein